MEVSGFLVDIHQRNTFKANVTIENAKIVDIREAEDVDQVFIIPGFIDAHIHIESSMLTPSQFAVEAVKHGTVATVSDPHEIANVVGIKGVKFMIEDGERVPLKFNFGAPSCVPATSFESSGAVIDSKGVEILLADERIKYLSEMMNYPGVLFHDIEVMRKIETAKSLKKPIDGHAPGLRGKDAKTYIEAGISTDHECFTLEEALEKIEYGMKIIIREGSAAKNLEALHPLFINHVDKLMLCSDDKHPDDLLLGHINSLVKRLRVKNYDIYDLLSSTSINPINHYGLDVGCLRVGDPADLVLVDNLEELNVLKTMINGEWVYANSKVRFKSEHLPATLNNFNIGPIIKDKLTLNTERNGSVKVKVIEAIDGELVTSKSIEELKIENNTIAADPTNDILKITVLNRYKEEKVSIGFIKGFGLKNGAIASSVAHDSHNIVCVGTDDASMMKAINGIISHQGGISFANDTDLDVLPLPIAGLMSLDGCEQVGKDYQRIDKLAKESGCNLTSPFMTLSFMALLVIPEIKMSDKGLFESESFNLVDLFYLGSESS